MIRRLSAAAMIHEFEFFFLFLKARLGTTRRAVLALLGASLLYFGVFAIVKSIQENAKSRQSRKDDPEDMAGKITMERWSEMSPEDRKTLLFISNSAIPEESKDNWAKLILNNPDKINMHDVVKVEADKRVYERTGKFPAP